MIKLKDACLDDADTLFRWLNKSDCLGNKQNTKTDVSYSDHLQWLSLKLSQSNCRIWMIKVDNTIVGQIRIDCVTNVAFIDIYIDEKHRRKKIAFEAIKRALCLYNSIFSGVSVEANIRCRNTASLKLFKRLGFIQVEKKKDFCKLVYSSKLMTKIVNFSNSNKMFSRVVQSIPLASQTFSKSYMSYVKGVSPLFVTKGQGARVWDVDGNEYIDFVSSLLPVVLGYCDPDVDQAIIKQLGNGISFSLPTELEIQLAEILINYIPSAEMVRFGKNGSDVTSAAVRLARAYTGRDKIAVCGYHGWHDWYISTTSRDEGIPDVVKALSTKIPFNNIEHVSEMLRHNPDDYAAIILEPCGAVEPEAGYLQELRVLTEKYGVLLIFDEIVTGFRIAMGGAQEVYKVLPDLSCFGKAMGNGMPISAIVGKFEFMRKMDDIFFSGTFGGETLSLVASIATLTKLESINGIDKINTSGKQLIVAMTEIIKNNNLHTLIEIRGPNWWPRFYFHPTNLDSAILVSLFRQECIAHGLLITAGLNLSVAHNSCSLFTEVLSRFNAAMIQLREYLDSKSARTFLRGEPVKPVFSIR